MNEGRPADAVVEAADAQLLDEQALVLQDARAGAEAVGHEDVDLVRDGEGRHVLHHDGRHTIDELAVVQAHTGCLLHLHHRARALQQAFLSFTYLPGQMDSVPEMGKAEAGIPSRRTP